MAFSRIVCICLLGIAAAVHGQAAPEPCSSPGQAFAYDNALVPMLSAVLEQVSGMPLAAYAREQIVLTMGLAEPSYRDGLRMRTVDMAKLGQLFLPARAVRAGPSTGPRERCEVSVA